MYFMHDMINHRSPCGHKRVKEKMYSIDGCKKQGLTLCEKDRPSLGDVVFTLCT